jgi:catabolite regulation protein CreA
MPGVIKRGAPMEGDQSDSPKPYSRCHGPLHSAQVQRHHAQVFMFQTKQGVVFKRSMAERRITLNSIKIVERVGYLSWCPKINEGSVFPRGTQLPRINFGQTTLSLSER